MGQPRPPHQAARPGHYSPQLPQAEAPGSTGHSVRRVLSTPPAGATSQHRAPQSLGTADLGHTRSHLLLTGTQPAPGKGTFSKHTSTILATRSLRQEQKEMLGGKSTATLRMNLWAATRVRACSPGTAHRGWWPRVPRSHSQRPGDPRTPHRCPASWLWEHRRNHRRDTSG